MSQASKPPSPPHRVSRAAGGIGAPATPLLRQPVARAVVDYWLAKPEACDSAEGIGQWWLDDPVPTRQLQAALDELVELGIAEWRGGVSGQPARYALAMPRAELARLLASDPKPDGASPH